MFQWKKNTHPLSDALTMYCLSLHALAFDRQVMEAVWPNNMARGQIWRQDKRRDFFFSYNRRQKKLQRNTEESERAATARRSPPARASCPTGRSGRRGSRWWWCWSRPSPAGCWCSAWEQCGPIARWGGPGCSQTWWRLKNTNTEAVLKRLDVNRGCNDEFIDVKISCCCCGKLLNVVWPLQACS